MILSLARARAFAAWGKMKRAPVIESGDNNNPFEFR
jgi:hypothetical protein